MFKLTYLLIGVLLLALFGILAFKITADVDRYEDIERGVIIKPSQSDGFKFEVPSPIEEEEEAVEEPAEEPSRGYSSYGGGGGGGSGIDWDSYIEYYREEDGDGDGCEENLQNTTWTDWLNISCLVNGTMNQTRNRTEYDAEDCGDFTNTTHIEYRTALNCTFCEVNLTNTTWTGWANITCLMNGKMNQTRNRTEYDANYCGQLSNQTFAEYRAVENCTFCEVNLTNTTWSLWTNITCLMNDTMNQSRNMTEYDANCCGQVSNTTYFEYKNNETCDYCTPLMINTTWTDWYNISICYVNSTIDQERNLTQYDNNSCGEIDNSTFYGHRYINCTA